MTRRDDATEQHNALPLFAPKVTQISGATDPATSVKAAAKVISSGRLGADQRWVLDLVRGRPGSTCPELAKAATYDVDEAVRQRIGRRLPELMRAGLVHREGERDGMSIWWPGPSPEKVNG